MQVSGLEERKKIAMWEYDFDKHGGDIGAIEVLPKLLPKGALVNFCYIHVITALAGAGATVALKAVGTDDILAATAITSLTEDALIDGVPNGAMANAIRATSAVPLTVTVAVAALTAGKFVVVCEYVVTE